MRIRLLVQGSVVAVSALVLATSCHDRKVPSPSSDSSDSADSQAEPSRVVGSRTSAAAKLGVVPGARKLVDDGVVPDYDAYSVSGPATQMPLPSQPGLAVASRDSIRPVPSFVWVSRDSQQAIDRRAANLGPDDVALAFIRDNASMYSLSPLSLATVVVRNTHDTGRGAIVVTLGQEVDGVSVQRARLAVVMNRDLDIVAVTGNLHGSAVPAKVQFDLNRSQALSAAVTDLTGTPTSATTFASLGVRAKTNRETFSATAAIGRRTFASPATLKPTLYALPDQLVPAFEIELDIAREHDPTPDAYAYTISAATGNVLSRRSLTDSDSYDYRVWADTTAPFTPLDGPIADVIPHPTGVPDPNFALDFIPPAFVAVDGLNTNPNGESDPWLPPAASESTGNNVDAYADLVLPDGFSPGDLRAAITAPGVFGHLYDTALAPNASDEQIMAAVTQLFYVNNWLHDWFYDSGFDEAAGNAQLDNFGRGGLGGDPLRAEAQDSIGFNNANMATFAEGTSPRMQMFVWTGEITLVGETAFNITAPPSIARDYDPAEVQRAFFGSDDLTQASGDLILVDDGTGVASDGCEPIVTDLTGAIALIDRGACAFVQKALNAQVAGALGTVIVNNDAANPDAPPPLGGASVDVVTPVVGISLNNGNVIKAEQDLGSTVVVDVSRAGQIEGLRRDGTIDNGIVAHEWGHYIHRRLANTCGGLQCGGMGEGWGDFLSLYMNLRPDDDPDAVYSFGAYATVLLSPDASYFGIRRFPYSTDMTRNALTFRHVQRGEPLPPTPSNLIFSSDNAEVHNSGEIWASMLFEAYTGLLKDGRLSFEEAQRRMADYVVAGLKAAPTNATFTEQRDAILAAAAATDLADLDVLARGFARRGAGTGAVSPPRTSADLVGVTESFVVAGDLAITAVELEEASPNCDGDGILDAGESGTLRLTVVNTGVLALSGTDVAVSSSDGAISFPEGAAASLDPIAPLASGVVELAVTLDGGLSGIQIIELVSSATDPDALNPAVSLTSTFRVNFDDNGARSSSDNVESEQSTWSVASDPVIGANVPWERAGERLNRTWSGANASTLSDERLETPAMVASASENLIVRLDQRYSFENDPGPIYWDGGVVEITSDGGATWTDIADFVDPGYGGPIGQIPNDPPTLTDNPLAGRSGFVGESPGYPAMSELVLDLGTQFAGQTVQIRFRVATDGFVGAPGWEIDNIDVSGITNLPFAVISEHAGVCRPHADAGADQTVRSLSFVRLDGSASTDLDGDSLRYRWTQVAGRRVFLFGRRSARPIFIAPFSLFQELTLRFELTVSDGNSADTDEVDVRVRPLFD